ncbi:MAG: Response regulator [Myxococcales bacterium]|nr:Response regulator [Myxococcales bacterium]
MHVGGLILVVEDDESIRDSLADLLRDEGYTVATAENGKVALQLLAKQKPCMVVLDLMMPVLDGWQVMDEMQKHADLQDIPVCVVSASTIVSPLRAVCVMPKPVNVARLLDTVEAHC